MAVDAGRHLVLVRHGKSDWSTWVPDRDRPVGPRGRRQATEAGAWLGAHGPRLDLAVVSPAVRAATTWELVAAGLPAPPPVVHDERVYTFDADDLLAVVAGLDPALPAVALVGHEPGLGELASSLAGDAVAMPTSAIAWLRWEGVWADAVDHARAGTATLHAAGRPPAAPGE